MSLNAVYLRRTNKVAPLAGRGENFSLVASLDANLRKLGYALDSNVALNMVFSDRAEVVKAAEFLVDEIKEMKGVRRYSPMYPNFPSQVMEASDAELYLNAIMHYFGDAVGLRILPDYPELKRPELDFDESKVTILRLGSRDDALNMVNNILMQTAAFGETERADISSLDFNDLIGAHGVSADVLPNRENRAWFAVYMERQGVRSARTVVDTATDVLRYAVALNDGDVSLAENTKFRLSRAQRREVMHLLSLLVVTKGNEQVVSDMLRHEQTWKRLGEAVHPGEFKGYPEAVEAFRQIRSGEAKTFNSRVEALIAGRDPLGAARLLKKRPGDFARRLDALLSLAPTLDVRKEIVSLFSTVASEVSPTVLVQARNHFIHRENTGPRVVFPKGSVAKMKSIEDTRPVLQWSITTHAAAAAMSALAGNFAKRPRLGRVWIDPEIAGMAIPFGVRSASKSLRTIGRGSRLPLGVDTNVLRFFIWWKDAASDSTLWGNRTDIDLSAVVLDKDFGSVFDITYYNLRERGAAHSGDITSAPDGASEFIDIDIERVKAQGGRYVLMNLFSYSGQDFVELPECFAGFMERRDLDSGEIYDPRTVTNRIDLSAKSKNACPFIFDLETREAIWVDLTQRLNGTRRYGRNVASNKDALVSTVEAMTSLRPPTLYELMSIHGAARGTLVPTREDAEFVFAEDGDFSPYEAERILAELL
jgi:hypothetical protein